MNMQITIAVITVNNSVRQNVTVFVRIEQKLVSLSGTEIRSSEEVSLMSVNQSGVVDLRQTK